MVLPLDPKRSQTEALKFFLSTLIIATCYSAKKLSLTVNTVLPITRAVSFPNCSRVPNCRGGVLRMGV